AVAAEVIEERVAGFEAPRGGQFARHTAGVGEGELVPGPVMSGGGPGRDRSGERYRREERRAADPVACPAGHSVLLAGERVARDVRVPVHEGAGRVVLPRPYVQRVERRQSEP